MERTAFLAYKKKSAAAFAAENSKSEFLKLGLLNLQMIQLRFLHNFIDRYAVEVS